MNNIDSVNNYINSVSNVVPINHYTDSNDLPYVRLIIYVIASGIKEKDVDYFKSDVFRKHISLIPDHYLEPIFGESVDDLTVEDYARIIIQNIENNEYDNRTLSFEHMNGE